MWMFYKHFQLTMPKWKLETIQRKNCLILDFMIIKGCECISCLFSKSNRIFETNSLYLAYFEQSSSVFVIYMWKMTSIPVLLIKVNAVWISNLQAEDKADVFST